MSKDSSPVHKASIMNRLNVTVRLRLDTGKVKQISCDPALLVWVHRHPDGVEAGGVDFPSEWLKTPFTDFVVQELWLDNGMHWTAEDGWVGDAKKFRGPHVESRINNLKLEDLPARLEQIDIENFSLIVERHLDADFDTIMKELVEKYGLSRILSNLSEQTEPHA